MDAKLWIDMFHLGVPVAEKVLRAVIVYAFLVVGLRLAGKRELAQLNPFDLVVLMTLSNTVQNAIIGDDNSVSGGIIGASTLLFVNYVVVRFLFGHRRLDQIVEGKSAVLMKEGRVCKDQLAKELITIAELQTVVRRQGLEGLHEVETCVLEPGGGFVIKRKCPSDEDVKHAELVGGIEALRSQLQRLEEKLAS